MNVGEYACWACMIICFITAMLYDNVFIGIGAGFFAAILVFHYNVSKDDVVQEQSE